MLQHHKEYTMFGCHRYTQTDTQTQTLINESWQPLTAECCLIYGVKGVLIWLVEPTILFSLQCDRLQSSSVHSIWFLSIPLCLPSCSPFHTAQLKVRCDSWPVITLLAWIMWYIRSSYCSEQLTQAGSQILQCRKSSLRLSNVMRLAPSSGSHAEMQVVKHWTAHFSPQLRDILCLMMKLIVYRP